MFFQLIENFIVSTPQMLTITRNILPDDVASNPVDHLMAGAGFRPWQIQASCSMNSERSSSHMIFHRAAWIFLCYDICCLLQFVFSQYLSFFLPFPALSGLLFLISSLFELLLPKFLEYTVNFKPKLPVLRKLQHKYKTLPTPSSDNLQLFFFQFSLDMS